MRPVNSELRAGEQTGLVQYDSRKVVPRAISRSRLGVCTSLRTMRGDGRQAQLVGDDEQEVGRTLLARRRVPPRPRRPARSSRPHSTRRLAGIAAGCCLPRRRFSMNGSCRAWFTTAMSRGGGNHWAGPTLASSPSTLLSLGKTVQNIRLDPRRGNQEPALIIDPVHPRQDPLAKVAVNVQRDRRAWHRRGRLGFCAGSALTAGDRLAQQDGHAFRHSRASGPA